ncbi:UPF0158 family protein [Fluviicola taffensis]|uniref:UPF0158 family protein n=1 Tax=Fluviicola taffensis TaxID=191579 RepID=UPI003137E8CB
MKKDEKDFGRLTQEQVNEIAETLEMGMKCFWCRTTNELVFVPETDEFSDGEEFYANEFEKLENNPEMFVEIEAMRSYDAFKVMKDFTERLKDNGLKFQLEDVLSSKKPFQKFKFIIDNSGDYREQWFAFKSEKYREWVMLQVDKF